MLNKSEDPNKALIDYRYAPLGGVNKSPDQLHIIDNVGMMYFNKLNINLREMIMMRIMMTSVMMARKIKRTKLQYQLP
ncbi:hypothetical protein DPMN_020916, partial [Dreissena polymorpha]